MATLPQRGNMPEVTPLSPELLRSVTALARSLVAAGRTWTLYPSEHPAVRMAVERLGTALGEACGKLSFSLGVTPDTLLLGGLPAATRDGGPIGEAAAWLHQRDILQLTFVPEVPDAALEKFLTLLAEDPRAVRERGGPGKEWAHIGHPSILVEQIDFSKVLEDRETEKTARNKDDLWKAIVGAVVERRQTRDDSIQKRMLEIAGDVFAIGDLAADVMAPNCSADGSPMLTCQAAAVVAAYRHLVEAVDVLAPERRAEVIGNLASATAALDPRVVMQILAHAEDARPAFGSSGGADVRRGIAEAFDDTKVAQLLATTLAIDGQASQRLASVFDTIAPDDERKHRVLSLTRTMLSETAFGKTTQFQTLWTSMEELLLSYNERPFVSEQYRESLDQIGARAEAMAAGEIPPELSEMVQSLDQENVRRLSVTLLVDLLNLEHNPARAPELARDVATLGEDLLMAGDYAGALEVTRALSCHAGDSRSVASVGARVALDELANTAAFREAFNDLDALDDGSALILAEICATVGPASTDAALKWLDEEAQTRGRQRATAIIRGFGAAAARRLAPLVGSGHWYAQRNAADLLGEIASPEGVPLLQPLLRGGDPRVTQSAVRALCHISDPAAARSVHTVLRATTGPQRQAVVAALVAERDPRVVPLLVRILDESEPFGNDHAIVIETLGAVGTLGGDQAVPAVDRMIRKRKWFAPQKVRALKQTGVQTLRQIGTPVAHAALQGAAATGDRLLKRFVREAGAA